MKRGNFLITTILILIASTIPYGNCRTVKTDSSALDYGFELGRNDNDLISTTVTCEVTHGFLPCTTTMLGLLFIITVYEVLLSFGEKYISSGSDLFFETFGSGIFGSGLFHLLGTFPQVGLILVSGMASSSDSVEEQVGISMGLLVGKMTMSLTLLWGLVVAFGSHDMTSRPQESTRSSVSDFKEPNAKPFTLTGYGVSSDVETSETARIIVASLIPFFILMLSNFTSTSWSRVLVLISLIATTAFLSSFFIYQGFRPWIQERRLEFVLRKYIQRNLLQNLLTTGRRPNIPVIREIFHMIDQDKNSFISTSELKALILGIQIEVAGLHDHDFVAKVMEQFDSSGDSKITEEEFVVGLSNWLIATKDQETVSKRKRKLFKTKEKASTKRSEEREELIGRKEGVGSRPRRRNEVWLNNSKAALLIIFGTAITIVLGQPLVQSIAQFSAAANIPSFLISYVVIPLALTIRQALRAIKSSMHKTEKDISLTLSEIYSGVFMNNMVGLFVFLGLVYIRDLTPNVLAEVLVVVVMCLVTGLYTSFNTKFQFWTCIVAFALYPLSLLFIYFLTALLRWA